MKRVVVLLLLALAAPAPVRAGELPPCTATEAGRVKSASVVVIATAKGKTRRHKKALRTTFRVEKVLKGEDVGKTITVTDCADWKCADVTFKRGDQRILLLFVDYGSKKAFTLFGPSCEQGWNGSALTLDDPHAQAVTDAAAATP